MTNRYIEIDTDAQRMISDESPDEAEERSLEPTDTTIIEMTVRALCECVMLQNIVVTPDHDYRGTRGNLTITPQSQTIPALAFNEKKTVRFTVKTERLLAGSYNKTVALTYQVVPIVAQEDGTMVIQVSLD